MKHRVETKIIINASLESVWKTFMNFQEHDQWNDFLRIQNGEKKVGDKIKVDFLSNGKVKMTMKPTVVEIQENEAFEWIGNLGIKGIFDGHHQFKFKDIGNNQTEFIQAEDFSGLLIRLLMKSVIEPTTIQFKKLNENFKLFIETKK